MALVGEKLLEQDAVREEISFELIGQNLPKLQRSWLPKSLALYVHFTRKVFMSNTLDHIAIKLICVYTHSEGLLWEHTYYSAPNGMKSTCFASIAFTI